MSITIIQNCKYLRQPLFEKIGYVKANVKIEQIIGKNKMQAEEKKY